MPYDQVTPRDLADQASPGDQHAVAEAENNAELWHRMLGHMSIKGVKVLLSKGKLPKLKSTDIDMCENCIMGKQKKVSFLKASRVPRSEKLELIYAELWGPSLVSSLGGSQYYVNIVVRYGFIS